MCVSLISRHIIMSYFHHVNFIIHDILIPLFVISLGIQFLSVNRIHMYNGMLLCLFIIPIFFINGMLLSSFISNQSYSYLFKNYGFHFILSGMELFETGFYNRFPKYLYYLHIYLMFSNIYVDLYLCSLVELYLKKHGGLLLHRIIGFVCCHFDPEGFQPKPVICFDLYRGYHVILSGDCALVDLYRS